ncbi:hypothetical protein B0H12DRAFT_1245448 [Mycena haematopus]|nr:hypothetical protein B0H12DRAFT_1245448 [Mycena haematopus]
MATVRWEHLKLHAPASFLSKLGGPMPILRSLELFDSGFDSGDDFAFNEAPQLRTVVLTSSVISKVTLPWSQLTSLTLNYTRADQCIQILAQTLNLVQCVLFLDDDEDRINSLTRMDLALPYLESLVLDEETYPEIVLNQQFLHSFIVPALCRLELDEPFLGAEPISALESFISRSGCRLQEVRITGNRTTPQDVYLRAFPSIPTFTFTCAMSIP